MRDFNFRRLSLYVCTLLFGAAAVLVGCSDDYDDSELWKNVNDLKERIAALESKVDGMNSDIEALQKIMDENVWVVKVTETDERDGYIIHFSDNKTSVIRNGKDGADGADGSDGADAPIIGVKKDTDGIYYWTITVNGVTDWLMDGNNKLPVTGADGQDGSDGGDGSDGRDGVTPVISIDAEGYWQVSYDKGTTFNRVLDANGQPVSAVGENSSIGSLFRSITVDENYAYFELANGTVITVPIRSNFYMLISRAPEVSTFVYGETQTYNVEEVGVSKTIVTKPDGWKVTYSDKVLSITAPAETHKDYADPQGTVAVIYFGSNGMSDMVSMEVVVDEDYTGPTTGADFTVDVTAITHNSVTFDITPDNKTQYWYVGYGLKSRIDEEGTGFLMEGQDGYLAMFGFYEAMGWLDGYAFKGDKAGHTLSMGMQPNTEYYAVVFGFECPGYYAPAILKTEILKVPFKTKHDVVINSVYRIDVSDVTWNGARYVCVPSDDIPYLHGFATKEDFDSQADDEAFMESVLQKLREEYRREFGNGPVEWDYFTSTGTQEVVVPYYDGVTYEIPLLDDTEYITYAFSVVDGNAGSPLSKTSFKTGKFNPTQDCTFEITSTVDRQDVEIKIVPSNKNINYYFDFNLRTNYNQFDSDLQYAVDDWVYTKWWAAERGNQLPELFYKGDITVELTGLYAITAYVVCVYGVSEDGSITTYPEIHEFITKSIPDEMGFRAPSPVTPRAGKPVRK